MRNHTFCYGCFFFTLFLGIEMLMAQAPSTRGVEFYASFMKNGYRTCNRGSEDYEKITIIASAQKACTITVSNPNTGWQTTATVNTNGVININIPYFQAYCEYSEFIENKGLYITSTDTISLYIANEATNSFDASNVLPANVLGSEYVIQTYGSYAPNNTCMYVDQGAFLIVATENNTTIDITPSKTTDLGKAANIPFTITLNRGQTYQVFSEPNMVYGDTGDLSGSIVQARDCKKIMVFNGSVLTGIPYGQDNGYDHIFEQAMPTIYWGKKFVITSSLNRSGDFVRVTALENNTTIRRNNVPLATINAGDMHEFFLSGTDISAFIETSRPCAVYLYQTTSAYDRSASGDPSMVWIAPVEQQIKEIPFATFSANSVTNHYVNIVTTTNNVNSIRLDNNNISALFSPVTGAPEYSYARISISMGTHVLRSNAGFTAHVYGFGNVRGYAYSIGSSAIDLNRDITINRIPSALLSNFSICENDSIQLGIITGSEYTSIRWNFGDGHTSMDSTPIHTYSNAGKYRIQAIIELKTVECFENLTDTLHTEISVYAPSTVRIKDTICSGNVYSRNGDSFTAHSDTLILYSLRTVHGCDSLVFVDLKVYPAYHFKKEITICFPDVYEFHGRILDKSGIYYDSLMTKDDCDSIYQLILTVNPSHHIEFDEIVCLNDPFKKYDFAIPGHKAPGHYFYERALQTTKGCDSIRSIAITIPDVSVEIEPLTINFCDERVAVLNAVTTEPNLLWSNGATTHSIEVYDYGSYHVTARDSGCSATTTLTIPPCPLNIILPNAITPSQQDGINDYFYLPNTDNIVDIEVLIHDRWGKLIFYSNNMYFRWDGKIEGEIASNATFSYTIHIKDLEGVRHRFAGIIVVL